MHEVVFQLEFLVFLFKMNYRFICVNISLQMSLSPTSLEIKIKELLFLEIQTISLEKYSHRNTIQPTYSQSIDLSHDRLLERLQTKNIISFTSPNNRVMQAFSFLLLRTAYGETLNQNLLNLIKIHLYRDELDLKVIDNSPLSELSSDEMKKFVVQFMVQLYFTDFQKIFQKSLARHPVILTIMSMFLRCILLKLGLDEAKHYQQNLPTETVIEVLNDFFDLNYRKNKDVYQYIENSMFLYQIDSQSIILGTFGVPNRQRQREIALNPETREGKVASFQPNDTVRFEEEESFLRESNMVSQGAPTPFFNTEEDHCKQTSFKTKNFSEIKTYPKNQQLKTYHQKPDTQEEQIINIKNYNVTTPSIDSIQDKLQFLTSPTHSDGSARNRAENRFDFAANLNQDYFIRERSHNRSDSIFDNQLPYRQYNCLCKNIARQKLAISSKVYSLVIQGRAYKNETMNIQVPSFILNGKLRKLSQINFKKNISEKVVEFKNQSFRTQRILSQAETQETVGRLNSPSFYSKRQHSPLRNKQQSYFKRPLTQYLPLSNQGSPKYTLLKPRITIKYFNL